MNKNIIKIISFIIIFILCTGWTSRLEFNNKFNSYSDKIIYSFDYNINNHDDPNEETSKLITNLINNDIISYGENNIYQKAINTSDNESTIVFEEEYRKKDLKNHNIFSNCFDDYVVDEDIKHLKISISGNFYCEDYGIEKLYFKSNNIVITNTDIKDGKYFVWDISQKDNNINITIYKSLNLILIGSIIIVIIVVIIFCGVIIKRKKI